jgi:predicted nucleic acid-binding protein
VADVVIDTSSLIFLSRLNRLALLDAFGSVSVADWVWTEYLAGEDKDPPSALVVHRAVSEGYLNLVDSHPPQSYLPGLGAGERAALFLASRGIATVLIIDDRKARLAAQALGIRTMSVPALLLSGAKRGRLTADELESDLYRLVDLGYHLAPRLFNDILKIASSEGP